MTTTASKNNDAPATRIIADCASYHSTRNGDVYRRLDVDFAEIPKLYREARAVGYNEEYANIADQRKLDRFYTDGGVNDPELSRAIDALTARIDELEIETPGTTQELRPWGASPSVGAYLSGSPASMRYREVDELSSAPVRMFVCTALGSAAGSDAFRVRAAAIGALVIKLSAQRPVELYAFDNSHFGRGVATRRSPDTLLTARMGTGPFSVSRLASFASASATRIFWFGVQRAMARQRGMITWSRSAAAEMLGVEPGDVFIPGTGNQHMEKMTSDPLGWVVGQLQRARQGGGAMHERCDRQLLS